MDDVVWYDWHDQRQSVGLYIGHVRCCMAAPWAHIVSFNYHRASIVSAFPLTDTRPGPL